MQNSKKLARMSLSINMQKIILLEKVDSLYTLRETSVMEKYFCTSSLVINGIY